MFIVCFPAQIWSDSYMYRVMVTVAMVACLAASAAAQKKEQQRIENANLVLNEILRMPETIPARLLARATCVVVIPSALKAAALVGASYGRGVMTCRKGTNFTEDWGPPSMIALEGGSFGFQLGGQATDFVFLLMNARAASSMLSSRVKIGVDTAAAAGPVGRDAEASLDVFMRAEILTYSRSRGIFGGISLTGSTLRADNRANEHLYGKPLNGKDIVVRNEVVAPAAAQGLLATLNHASPKRMVSNV